MEASVARVAKSCAVRIDADRFIGSGFFVAPQMVVTCAHVVGSRSQVTIEWQGRRLTARVVLCRPEERGRAEYWGFPDLAVLAIDDLIAHPVAWLDENPPVPGDTLQAYGFSEKTPQSGAQADGLQVVVASQAGDYWRVKDDQIVGGLSGCLAVNGRTGLVAGVVKASRDQGNALGGWIVPASHVKPLLSPEVVLRRFDDEWLRALLAPLMPMFEAQQRTSQMLPYKLLDGPAPPLGQIYVRQQAADSQPLDVQEAINSRLHAVFIGLPGAGKSSLIQHICGEAARWWLHPVGDPPFGPVVPVPLSAGSLASGGPLADVLATKTTAELGAYLDVELPPTIFIRPPAPGVRWLVLVDGLDEVLDAEKRSLLIKMLEHRIRSQDDIWRFIITTRPLNNLDLDNLIDAARGSFRLLPFDEKRITEFAIAWFRVRDPERATEQAKRFIQQASAPPLTGVVSVPLLATIAAIVFESHPGRGLPADISGLYSEFVRFLLVERRRQVSEEGLRSRLEDFSQAGQELSAWITANSELLLRKTAIRWFFDSQIPILDAAQEILSALHPSPIYAAPAWRPALWLFLTETGLLVTNRARLDWIHLSIAEYLASRELISHPNPRKWLWLAGSSTTANLARFSLADQLSTGRLPIRSLRRLARRGFRLAVIENLLASGNLFTDAQILTLLNYALRSAARNRDYPSLRPDLTMFLIRPAGVEGLRSAVRSHRRRTITRIAAANALLAHIVAADRLFAARSLLSFAESRRVSIRDRVAAAEQLAAQDARQGQALPRRHRAELTVMASRATVIMRDLTQRRMLSANRWFKVIDSAKNGIPESAEREALYRLLTSWSVGTDGRTEAITRLAGFSDMRGISWLAAAARRSIRATVLLIPIGLVLLILAVTTNRWSTIVIGLIVLGFPIVYIFGYLWHLATRWPRALERLRRTVVGLEHLPVAREAMPLISEALAREGWGPDAPRGWVRMFTSDWTEYAWAIIEAHSPREQLRHITESYDSGQNEEADRELHNLWARIGPVRRSRIARYACTWARNSPRSARPLLTAILTEKGISPFRRRKMKRLLDVLGGWVNA
jgi:hypothetical protein